MAEDWGSAVASQGSGSEAHMSTGSLATQHDSDVLTLEAIVDTLRDQRVRGPQLFRINREFKGLLGQGADGQVRAIDEKIWDDTHRTVRSKWKAAYVAVKRYGPRRQDPPIGSGSGFAAGYMRAAASEVFTLAHAGFKKHPNIVQILGWGLCLDSLENPSASCCGSLQLPLVVLERAVGDFSEFLAYAFPKPVVNSKGREEEEPDTPAATAQSRRRIDPQAAAEAGQYNSIPLLSKEWGLKGMDRYELVRLLCLDVGRGLGALHQERFIHGDLKPENILIFEGSGRYVAKLCDFGRSKRQREQVSGSIQGQTAEDGNEGRIKYDGTNAWKPPWISDEPVLFDELQKYDIAVYGMVVWSAFCLGGKPPPQRSNFQKFLETAQGHVDILQKRTGWVYNFSEIEWLPTWMAGRMPTMRVSGSEAGRVRRVIDSTLDRNKAGDLEPWMHLRTSAEVYFGGMLSKRRRELRKADATRQAWLALRKSRRRRRTNVKLGTAEKEIFNELASLRENQPDSVDEITCPTCLTIHPQDDSVLASLATEEPEPDDSTDSCLRNPRHALHRAFRICLSRVSSDVDRENTRIYDLLKRPMDFEGGSAIMYCLARFRSEAKLESWRKTPKSNILEKMLKAEKTPDICTLAWLCAGEVGMNEVKTLSSDYATWKMVLEAKPLNQSERLERFLLLLQFGASIEAMLLHPINGEIRSVLGWFLLFCSHKTVLTCASKICERFKQTRASDTSPLSPDTISYMTAHPRSWRVSALKDLARDEGKYGHLYELLKSKLVELVEVRTHDLVVDSRRALTDQHDITIDPQSLHGPDETSPLLYPERSPSPPRRAYTLGLLPKGWQRIKTGSSHFEEHVTGSVTTIAPTQNVDSARLTTIRIGHLGSGKIFQTQLCQFVQPRVRDGSNLDFEKDVQARFPSYDAKFFNSEPERVMPDDDVLERLSASGSVGITSFAVHIPDLGIILGVISFLSNGIRTVGNAIYSFFAFLVIIITMVLWVLLQLVYITLAFTIPLGLSFFLTWVTMPIELTFSCIVVVGTVISIFIGSIINACCEPLGSVVAIIAAIPVGIKLALMLMDWICSLAPTGHYSDGTECVKCWYWAITFLRCHLDSA